MNVRQIVDEIDGGIRRMIEENRIKISTAVFCWIFKLALISKLEQAGAKYDPTLENEWGATGNNTTDKKKFFAFKKSDEATEQEILESLKRMHNTLIEYMTEIGDLKSLYFNIQKVEIRDRDAFSDLVRGILVVKEVNNDSQ